MMKTLEDMEKSGGKEGLTCRKNGRMHSVSPGHIRWSSYLVPWGELWELGWDHGCDRIAESQDLGLGVSVWELEVPAAII